MNTSALAALLPTFAYGTKTETDFKAALELLEVDPENGQIYWRVARGVSVKPGDLAGYLHKGVWSVKVNGKLFQRCHLIWYHVHGWLPGYPNAAGISLDHKNRDASDDRIENLRLATGREQAINRDMLSQSVSGSTGVARRPEVRHKKRPWRARIRIDAPGSDGGKRIERTFRTKREAITQRVLWEIEHYGEFAPIT